MEEKEEGITLGQLFSVMFGRKLLLLIITLVVFIVGTLCFKFLYNDNQEYYYSDFTYNSTQLLDGTYIDNSKFDYNYLITEINLNNIKNSSDEFSSIDVEKMVDENGISISKATTYVVINEVETSEVESISFNISAKAKYFSSKSQAKNFIDAVAQTPVTTNLATIETSNYSSYLASYLDLYSEANNYKSMVEYLELQLDLLQDKYANLMLEYGDVVLEGGKTLDTKLCAMNTYFDTYNLQYLIDEIDTFGYVKEDSSYKTQLVTERQSLLLTYNTNKIKISNLQTERDKLVSATSTTNSSLITVEISAYNEEIISLTNENVDLAKDIKNINLKLGNVANLDVDDIYPNDDQTSTVLASDLAAFETKLDSYKTKLQSYTDEYIEDENEVVNKYLTISYTNASIILEDGGVSVIIYALLFLVLGIVVGCVVNLCLDYKKLSPTYNIKEEPKSIESNEDKDNN